MSILAGMFRNTKYVQYLFDKISCDTICVDINYKTNNFNFLETNFYENMVGDSKFLCMIKIQLQDTFVGLYCNNNILKINYDNIVHKLLETGFYHKISGKNCCLLIDLQLYNECKNRSINFLNCNSSLDFTTDSTNNIRTNNSLTRTLFSNISKFFGLTKK